jgi:gliding motility-associated-like protein
MKKIILLLIISLTCKLGYSQTEIVFDAVTDGSTVNTCLGFLIASQGQGTSQYEINEDYTVTICPDNPDDVITITFNTFDLDPTDLLPGNPSNADVMHVFDGPNTSSPTLGDYTGDGLQGAVIKATFLNPSGCITLRFVSNSVGVGMFSASVTCTTPCSDPFADGELVNGITSDSIHVCIGELIQFQENGSFAQMGFNLVDYSWDFMDGTLGNGQTVTHAYSEPGYYRVQLFVTDDNGCTNNNLIDLDVKVATPPDFELFMKDTTICIGETLDLKADPLLYENTWYDIIGSIEIEDGCMYDTLLGVAQELELIQTDFISGITITDISQIESMCLEIEHTFIGDLVISIICPNGQSAILHQQGGGGCYLGEPVEEDGINCDDPTTYGTPYEYCFTPGATETWVEYVDNNNWPPTLPADDYEPVEPLDQLIGCPANGVWTLSVVDNWGADDGKVFSFSLNLSPDLYGDIVEFTPQHSSPSDSSFWHYPSTFGTYLSSDADTMTIVPTVAGTYVYPYTVVNDFGCSNDTSITVTVFEVQLPFTIEDQFVCPESEFFVGGDFQPCQFNLHLDDSFGDGWNGNNIEVTVNGTATSYTVSDTDNDGLFLDIPIILNQNDVITFLFDGLGSFTSECSYQLIDCNGQIVFQDGGNWTPPLTTLQTYNVNMQGGAPGYSFFWTPANIFVDPTVSVPTATIENTTTITMSYFPTDHPMCVVSDNMVATLIPDTYAGVDSTVNYCTNLTSLDLFQYLGPGVATTGVWTDPNGIVITMPYDISGNLNGDFVYTVGAQTCISIATITNLIKSEPVIQSNFITDPDICIGETAYFLNSNVFGNLASMNVSYGDTSALYDATLNYDTLIYVYPYVGTFDLNVNMVSTNGCIYNDSFPNIVNVHDYPIAEFTVYPEVVTMLDPVFTVTNNSSSGIESFNWLFTGADEDSSTVSPQVINYPFEAGMYPITLFIEDSVGCRDSITKMVIIEDIPLVYFPNSFTPNGDEYNQDWRIFASGIDIQDFELKIYDRWGELIFETHDPKVGWNGTFNNGMCPTGQYIWKMEAVETTKNLRFKKDGIINLLK